MKLMELYFSQPCTCLGPFSGAMYLVLSKEISTTRTALSILTSPVTFPLISGGTGLAKEMLEKLARGS